MGEGGAVNPPAAIANAVTDALSPFGIAINQTPITPERIAMAVAAAKPHMTEIIREIDLEQTAEDIEIAARLSHVRPLATLRDKIDPRRAALIVVDMQNDFCAVGGMMSNEGFDVSEVQKTASRLPPCSRPHDPLGLWSSLFATSIRPAGVFSGGQNKPANMYLSDSWLEQAARTRKGSYTRRQVCAEGSWEGDFYGDIRPSPASRWSPNTVTAPSITPISIRSCAPTGSAR